MDGKQLESLIHKKIPITKAMGLRVQKIGSRDIILNFPLKNNINHLGTGFGGSLMAAEAVACWSWYLAQMDKAGLKGSLVVKTSNIRFVRPVTDDFQVKCEGMSRLQWKQFVSVLENRGSANFKMVADVICKRKLCSRFTGHFVVKILNPF